MMINNPKITSVQPKNKTIQQPYYISIYDPRMYFISCQPEKLFETEFAERGRFVLECEHDSQY